MAEAAEARQDVVKEAARKEMPENARTSRSISVSTENAARLAKEADRRDVSVAYLVNKIVARALPALEATDLDAVFPVADPTVGQARG